MGNENAEYLLACLKAGLWVWWLTSDGPVRATDVVDGKLLDVEPGPCLIFENAVGRYAALRNIPIEKFVVTSADLARWPNPDEKPKPDPIHRYEILDS